MLTLQLVVAPNGDLHSALKHDYDSNDKLLCEEGLGG
jgi:hypothetical protein